VYRQAAKDGRLRSPEVITPMANQRSLRKIAFVTDRSPDNLEAALRRSQRKLRSARREIDLGQRSSCISGAPTASCRNAGIDIGTCLTQIEDHQLITATDGDWRPENPEAGIGTTAEIEWIIIWIAAKIGLITAGITNRHVFDEFITRIDTYAIRQGSLQVPGNPPQGRIGRIGEFSTVPDVHIGIDLTSSEHTDYTDQNTGNDDRNDHLDQRKSTIAPD